MAKKKCLFKKPDLDYNEEDFFTSRCFQVNSEVEFKEIPSNGEEYLLKVIKERENYAPVIYCDHKRIFKKLQRKQIGNYTPITDATAPDALKPTIEWQNIQVADFSDVRCYIQNMHAKKLLPTAIRDVELSKHRVKNWEPLFDEEPTMTHVVGLSQSILDNGLDLLVERLDLVEPGQSIDRRTGQWIYTLLAVTRYPHLHDTTAKLRDLARKCLEIRSRLNPDDENAKELATPMNLFVCLIARYFGNMDLADCFYER